MARGRKDAIAEVKAMANLGEIVEGLTGHPPTASGKYHCPLCGSGDGPKGTPAGSIERDGTRYHCYSCGFQGDLLDLMGAMHGIDDKGEQLRIAREIVGMEAAPTGHPVPAAGGPSDPPSHRGQRPQAEAGGIERERAYVAEARANVGHPEAVAYLGGRGVGIEAARSLGLGYDPSAHRVVIPYPGSDYYHIDRYVGEPGPRTPKYTKPKASDVGPQPIWNPAALECERIIVVEGPMDAIALALAGHGTETVALGGTAHRGLVDELARRGFKGQVVVALDADVAGREAQAEAVGELRRARVAAIGIDTWASLGAKDAGEAWERDPAALGEALARDLEGAAREAREATRREAMEALEGLRAITSDTALGNLFMLTDARDPIPTGLGGLDRILGGGLSTGLYVLGATSSLGKTTLLGQMADHMAAMGTPVLFVTLEQSAEEMTAKAVSRHMATHGPASGVATASDLMSRRFREAAGRIASEAITRAFEGYQATVGDRITYLVADGEPTLEEVGAAAALMRDGHGVAPVVIVDYLQLLRPPDGSLSDKQSVDRNVTGLRRLARDLKTPVVGISSLNRASYSGTVGMEAFKESGAIEYGADVLMGLQPKRIAEVNSVRESERRSKALEIYEDIRRREEKDVTLTILKNRWGRITGESDGVPLTFRARESRFTEP